VIDWTPAQRPARRELRGRYVQLRPLEVADAEPLLAAAEESTWTFLPYDADEYAALLPSFAAGDDPLFFTICVAGEPQGVASYLRITEEHGVIEIGHIWFGRDLRQTRAATEAIYLLSAHAFDDLGYRRLEWKCNALNDASRRAAERFGFSFEGVFRNHMVIKGENRDSAWYSITDDEWPELKRCYEAWLAPENFDEDGRQLKPLSGSS
jgi:RimJ/RimL family protein N-acetyltransferase